ncbi:helix-turn-helix domain-containing protein [Actinosynnema sp. CS-041913]|uniref:helix-turn-helix domain-containing protein n=1 Tax=Actinosynnema sp. CS-041913 TaxID=3239917 RepID=UPI003D8D5978
MRPERLTTVRSRELGEELRQARVRLNLKADKLSKSLGWSASKISRIEHGVRGTSGFDLGALLGRLEVDPATRERIRRLGEERDLGYFLRSHDGRLSDNLASLIIHERAALTMTAYEPMVIPGQLQTPAYAAAIITTVGDFRPEDLDFFVATRMERQTRLTGPGAPVTTFYIHEAALHSVVGDYGVMHDQMLRLAFMCGWSSRLRPRVIPFSAPGSNAVRTTFNLMAFAPPIKPVAYTETDTATLFIEADQALDAYKRRVGLLAKLALDAEQSRSVFAHWADVYGRREDRDDHWKELA